MGTSTRPRQDTLPSDTNVVPGGEYLRLPDACHDLQYATDHKPIVAIALQHVTRGCCVFNRHQEKRARRVQKNNPAHCLPSLGRRIDMKKAQAAPKNRPRFSRSKESTTCTFCITSEYRGKLFPGASLHSHYVLPKCCCCTSIKRNHPNSKLVNAKIRSKGSFGAGPRYILPVLLISVRPNVSAS